MILPHTFIEIILSLTQSEVEQLSVTGKCYTLYLLTTEEPAKGKCDRHR